MTQKSQRGTGVEDLTEQPAELVPPDDGFGTPGDGTFNTPPIVEAADSGPFLHNNSVATIEGGVMVVTTEAEHPESRGCAYLTAHCQSFILLTNTQVLGIARFLRIASGWEFRI